MVKQLTVREVFDNFELELSNGLKYRTIPPDSFYMWSARDHVELDTDEMTIYNKRREKMLGVVRV